MKRNYSDDGLTLVEVLAALMIALLVCVPMIAMFQELGRSWKAVTVSESLNAAAEMADEALQREFQNLQDVSYGSSAPPNQAVIGHDISGDTIWIGVQSSGPQSVLVIKDTTSGQTVTLRPAQASYTGTTFSINGRVVTCWLVVTSTVDSSRRLQKNATFVIQGGV